MESEVPFFSYSTIVEGGSNIATCHSQFFYDLLLPQTFITLETEPIVNNYKPIPVILGRLFLVTVDALINCKNGLMNLSFENITLELNVFNICRQPNEENENEDDIDKKNYLNLV